MIDKLVGMVKKVFGTDKDRVVGEFIQRIDKAVEEMGIDRRGFSMQKAMYRDVLKMVSEKRGETEARELCAWIMDYIKEYGKPPKSRSVRKKAGLL